MRDWNALYEKVGPLRYQSSEADCVPTTIVNGLLVLLGRHLHPKLQHLIWSLSSDRENLVGTGYVCCDAISGLLNSWFGRAHQDGYEKKSLQGYSSKIIEGKAAGLGQGNILMRSLNNGGVACINTGKNSEHYSLVLEIEDEYFLGFDCSWNKKIRSRLDSLQVYQGLVNTKWSREQLQEELETSQWIHLLSKN